MPASPSEIHLDRPSSAQRSRRSVAMELVSPYISRADSANLFRAMGFTEPAVEEIGQKEKTTFFNSPENKNRALDTVVQQEWLHLKQWFSYHLAEHTLPFAPMDGRTVYPPVRSLTDPDELANEPYAYIHFKNDPAVQSTYGFLVFDIDAIRISRVPYQHGHRYLTTVELHFKLYNLTIQITHSKILQTDTFGITFLTDKSHKTTPIHPSAVLKAIALYNHLPELFTLIQPAWYAKLEVLYKHNPEDLKQLKAHYQLKRDDHRRLTFQDIQDDTQSFTFLMRAIQTTDLPAYQRYKEIPVLINGAQYLKDGVLTDYIQAILAFYYPSGTLRARMPLSASTESLFTHIQQVKMLIANEHSQTITFKITQPNAPAKVQCSYDPSWSHWSKNKNQFKQDMKSFIRQRWFRLNLRDMHPDAGIQLSGMMSYYISNINDRPAIRVGLLLSKRPTDVSFAYMNEGYYRTVIDVVQTTLTERSAIAFDIPDAVKKHPEFHRELHRYLLYPRDALQVYMDYGIQYVLDKVPFVYKDSKNISLKGIAYEGTRDGETIASRASPVKPVSPTKEITEDAIDPAAFQYDVYQWIDHLTDDPNLRSKLNNADPRHYAEGEYANLRTLVRAHYIYSQTDYGYEWDDIKNEFIFILRLYHHLKPKPAMAAASVSASASSPSRSPAAPTIKNRLFFTNALGYGETVQITTNNTYSQLDDSRHLVYHEGNNITIQITLKTPDTTAFIQRWFKYNESDPKSLVSKIMNLVYKLTKNNTFGNRVSIQLSVKTE